MAIHSELGIPVKYIGVGETIEDLQKFDSNQFVNALFERIRRGEKRRMLNIRSNASRKLEEA